MRVARCHYVLTSVNPTRERSALADAPSRTAVVVDIVQYWPGNPPAARRNHHPGNGLHILAGDGHAVWHSVSGLTELYSRFNFLPSTVTSNLANADLALGQ